MKKKVFVITGSRAEYGLLQGLIKRFDDSNSFDLKIIVSGMHPVSYTHLTLPTNREV